MSWRRQPLFSRHINLLRHIARARAQLVGRVNWVSLIVCILFLGVVVVLDRVRRPMQVSIVVSTSEVEFNASKVQLLSPNDYQNFAISRIHNLNITRTDTRQLSFIGDRFATCSFSHVRAEPLTLSGPSIIKLLYIDGVFSVKTSAVVEGHLTSQPESTVDCTKTTPTVDVSPRLLSQLGGDSLNFTTYKNGSIDLQGINSSVEDRQIPVNGEVRFAYRNASLGREVSTLLAHSSPTVNRISFPSTGISQPIDPNNILVVVPTDQFWVQRISISEGIILNMEGIAAEVSSGPGTGALRTVTPTLLTEWTNGNRVWAFILSGAALFLAVWKQIVSSKA